MTASEWEAELRELRRDLGALAPMRLRWRWKAHLKGEATLFDQMFGEGIEHDLWFALYDESARPGDRPIVEVEVVPDRAINAISQGAPVLVAGRPMPGHAVVVVIEDRTYWPTYPCTLSLLAPRL